MSISTNNHTLIYLLGYLEEEEWVDALQFETDLNRELVNKLLQEVDNRYGGMKEAVDKLIKEQVVRRIEG